MTTGYQIVNAITPSGTNIVSQAEVKNYIKQTADVAAENTLVDQIIKAAVYQGQEITWRQMNSELTIVSTVDIDYPDSDGKYIIYLPFQNSTLVISSIDAIDRDGDSVSITDDDYELRGNKVRIKLSNVNGYRFVFTYTATISTTLMDNYKEPVLALCGYKYLNRDETSTAKMVEILESLIVYQEWA